MNEDQLIESMGEAAWNCSMPIKYSGIEDSAKSNIRKQMLAVLNVVKACNARADPVRKVKLPERYCRGYAMLPDEIGRWLDREDVIAALKDANVEIEP